MTLNEPSEREVGHGETDECNGFSGMTFEVFGQTTEITDPGERSFGPPA
jgi:hypothetical protein